MVMKLGSVGVSVVSWQRRLAALTFSWRYRGVINGRFGPATVTATVEYQRYLADLRLYAGEIDGKVGPMTLGADAAFRAMNDPRGAVPVPVVEQSADVNLRMYDVAAGYLGLKEQAGPGTHPVLAEMFRLAPYWLDQDDSKTAWCGIFRGYVGHLTATGMPAAHYRAAAWAAWGKAVPLASARRGDTIVLSRSGGFHVAFVHSYVSGAGTIRCLGGNQSNAVTLANFKVGGVKAVRRA